MNRLLFRHARVLDPAPGLDAPGDLLVEGERIAAVGGDLSAAARDAEAVMAEGLCLAPGLVDMRVQLHEPSIDRPISASVALFAQFVDQVIHGDPNRPTNEDT